MMADSTDDLILGHNYIVYHPGRRMRLGNFTPPAGAWNIGYTISGKVREIFDQGTVLLQPHDFTIIKPGGIHGWEVPRDASEPWQVVWFLFVPKPDWLCRLDFPEEFPKFSRIPLAGWKNDAKIRRSLLQAERFAKMPENRALAMNAIERALLWLPANPRTANSRIDERIQLAKHMFSKKLTNPPSVPEVAAACGLSHSRLAGLFRKQVGQSPKVWLERTRLNRAREMLLSTGLPVKLIAADCGYDDQRHFATRFRKLFELTPSQIRACRFKLQFSD